MQTLIAQSLSAILACALQQMLARARSLRAVALNDDVSNRVRTLAFSIKRAKKKHDHMGTCLF